MNKGQAIKSKISGNRLTRIDEVRGFTLISMILYHFMWDLNYIAGIRMKWYDGPIGEIWQQSICISFILISGFCFNLGKHHFKRQMEVFIAGAIVTAVTLIAMPENRIIFGILTFLGSAGLIMIGIDKIHRKLEEKVNSKVLNVVMAIVSLLLFIVFYDVYYESINLFFTKIRMPAFLYKGYLATFIGFADPDFFSTDYFSLLPWMFLYMMGYYIYRIMGFIKESKAEGSILDMLKGRKWVSSFDFLGRNSLIIYLLHQPVLYGITLLVLELQ